MTLERAMEKLADANTRITELEAAMRRAIEIIDTNLYHQREKVVDASRLLERALDTDK